MQELAPESWPPGPVRKCAARNWFCQPQVSSVNGIDSKWLRYFGHVCNARLLNMFCRGRCTVISHDFTTGTFEAAVIAIRNSKRCWGNNLEAYTVEGHTYAPLGVVNGLCFNVEASKLAGPRGRRHEPGRDMLKVDTGCTSLVYFGNYDVQKMFKKSTREFVTELIWAVSSSSCLHSSTSPEEWHPQLQFLAKILVNCNDARWDTRAKMCKAAPVLNRTVSWPVRMRMVHLHLFDSICL